MRHLSWLGGNMKWAGLLVNGSDWSVHNKIVKLRLGLDFGEKEIII